MDASRENLATIEHAPRLEKQTSRAAESLHRRRVTPPEELEAGIVHHHSFEPAPRLAPKAAGASGVVSPGTGTLQDVVKN